MDEFFKSLKDNLENRNEPDFNAAAWKRVQAKMKAETAEHKPAKPIAWWLPVLALLLAGSVGLNYWFYTNYQSFQTTQIPQGTTLFTHQIDTIYKTNVIYQRDTIYQTKYIKQTVSSNKPSINNPIVKTAPIHSFFASPSKYDKPFSTADHTLTSATLSSKTNLTTANLKDFKSTKAIQKKALINKTLSPLATLDFKALKSNNQLKIANKSPFTLPKKRQSFFDVVYPMRPKGFSLGINGGGVFPIGENVENEMSYIIGVQPSLIFNEHFSLFSECSFIHSIFEAKDMNETIGVPFYPSPNDEYEFKKAEVEQTMLQVGVGLQYTFGEYYKLKPFVGVGWFALRMFPYEVIYKFEHTILDDDNFSINNTVNTNTLIQNQLLTKAGIAYRFSSKWAIQLEGYYRFNLNETEASTPKMIGLRTGIYRRF